MKEDFYYLYFLRGHASPRRVPGKTSGFDQEAKTGKRGISYSKVFIGIFLGEAKQGRVNFVEWTRLNDCRGLWVIGMVSSCRGMIQGRGNTSLVYKNGIKGVPEAINTRIVGLHI